MSRSQPPFQTTPVKPKVDALLCWHYLLPDHKELRKKLAIDMRAHWIGLPTPVEFMDHFMDKAPRRLPSATLVKFPSTKGNSENDMYVPLVSLAGRLCATP